MLCPCSFSVCMLFSSTGAGRLCSIAIATNAGRSASELRRGLSCAPAQQLAHDALLGQHLRDKSRPQPHQSCPAPQQGKGAHKHNRWPCACCRMRPSPKTAAEGTQAPVNIPAGWPLVTLPTHLPDATSTTRPSPAGFGAGILPSGQAGGQTGRNPGIERL